MTVFVLLPSAPRSLLIRDQVGDFMACWLGVWSQKITKKNVMAFPMVIAPVTAWDKRHPPML